MLALWYGIIAVIALLIVRVGFWLIDRYYRPMD